MKYFWLLLRLPLDLLRYFVTYFPGPWGNFLRYWFWKPQLGRLGRRVTIGEGTFFENPKYIFLDDDVWIDRYVTILAGPDMRPRKVYHRENDRYEKVVGMVHIESYCHIAPYVIINGKAGVEIREKTGISAGTKIYSLSHHYRDLSDPEGEEYFPFSPLTPWGEQAMISGPVVLGPEAAVGFDCRLMPGSGLGKRSWLGVGQTLFDQVPDGYIRDDRGERPLSTTQMKS